MSEVLGDAEPVDDPTDDFDDYEYDDGFDREPGRVSRLVRSVATPEALAIAGLIIAVASLWTIPAVDVAAGSLAISHDFSSTFAERARDVGQLIVALVGGALGTFARRPERAADGAPRSEGWVGHVSGAAVLIATLSAVFAIVSLLIAGTSHPPNSGNQFPQGSVASVPAFPESAPSIVFATPSP